MINIFNSYLKIFAVVLIISSCTPIMAEPVQTATAYIPVSESTPIPLVYEPLTPENVYSLTLLARWKFDTRVERLVFAPNADVLYADSRNLAQNWDIYGGKVEQVLAENRVMLVDSYSETKVLSPDNKYSAHLEMSGDLRIKNLLRPTTSLLYYLDDAISVSFFPGGQAIVVAFPDGQVWFVNNSQWTERLLTLEDEHGYYDDNLHPDLLINTKDGIRQIAFSLDGSILAILFKDETIELWNVPTLSRYLSIDIDKSNENQTHKLAFSPNSEILAVGSKDGYIDLWDTKTGQLLAKLEGHQDYYAQVDALAFSPSNRLLVSLHNGIWAYVWGILPGNIEDAEANSTAIANSVTTSSISIAALPSPTTTPISSLPDYQPQTPFAWPISMPSTTQIMEARECPIETLAESRYPKGMSYWELESVYPLNSSCDWAVLAFAYRSHFDDKDSIPEEGKRAFFESIRQNPAFAMTTPLFYPYFNSMELVDAPPFAKQPITSAVIDYSWGGIGEPSHVSYHIEINNAQLPTDQIKLRVQAQPDDLTSNLTSSVDSEKIQGIGKALTDFLPVQLPFTLENCTDNSPDWNIYLTFLDETTQTVKTHGSNFFNAGGPWFIEIDGQNYIQFSSALVGAVSGLFEALGLPLGQPFAMYCSSVGIFDLAFP